MKSALTSDGFEIIPSVLGEDEMKLLRQELSALNIAPGHRRLAKRVPSVDALASSPAIVNLLETAVGTRPVLVRSIFFDKTPEANWLVPWHQDLTIAVQQRIDVAGYGPWSIKEGIPHVQPPVELLETMVTLRLHLDDCDEANGALKVVPRSHRQGRLDARQITEARQQGVEVTCGVRAGDVLLMRPLLLHASSQAVTPAHRRVVHLEYATVPLAAELAWAETSSG